MENTERLENLSTEISDEIKNVQDSYVKILNLKNILENTNSNLKNSEQQEAYRNHLIEKCDEALRRFK